MSEDVRQALSKYNSAMQQLERAEEEVQLALKEVKNCAQSSTVNVDGQFFQVRERKDKLYLCELTGKPKGRPKGSKNTKPRKSKGTGTGAVSTDTGTLIEPLDFALEASAEASHAPTNGVSETIAVYGEESA